MQPLENPAIALELRARVANAALAYANARIAARASLCVSTSAEQSELAESLYRASDTAFNEFENTIRDCARALRHELQNTPIGDGLPSFARKT